MIVTTAWGTCLGWLIACAIVLAARLHVVPVPASFGLASDPKALEKLFFVSLSAAGSNTITMDGIDSQPGTKTTVALRMTQSLSIVGWAFPPSAKGGCEAVGLVLDKKLIFPGVSGNARPDVAAAYENSAVTNVSYLIQVPASHIGAGTHRGYVVCVDAAQEATRSFTPLIISVR